MYKANQMLDVLDWLEGALRYGFLSREVNIPPYVPL